MPYFVGTVVLIVLALSVAVWYYRGKALANERSDDAAEADSRARNEAEDGRNAAMVDDWKARMDKAKENQDAQAAVDGWRSLTK